MKQKMIDFLLANANPSIVCRIKKRFYRISVRKKNTNYTNRI